MSCCRLPAYASLCRSRYRPREELSQAMAPLHAGDGCGTDRADVDMTRGAGVSGAAVAHSPRGCEHTVGVGSSYGRGPEPAMCVHTAGVEGVTRGERAAGRP